jgi:thiol-disulfide isomerase/thioredoxin
MKSIPTLFKAVCLVLMLAGGWRYAFTAGAGPVHWYDSVEEASAEARRENRPMMIDFWATWCAACRVMESDVYSSDEFEEATSRLYPVRIDYDKKTALARKYNVASLPTIVFTDSYGNELFRYSGYIGSKPLLDLVRALPADVSEFNHFNRVLATDKNNFAALEGMGRNLRAAGLFRASNDYYARAVERPDAKADASKRETIMTEMGINALEIKEAKQAAGIFEKCLKEFPASAKKASWMLGLGQAYAFGEKKDRSKARKYLEALIRENPASDISGRALELLKTL